LRPLRFLSRDEARDWAAILYTPVLTACAAGLVLVIWLGPWPDATAGQRLNFLGASLLGLLGLIAMGTFFLQRRTVNLKVETPGGGSVEVENVTPSA
jgi:peptidoglycan biosynthesis protein MviN/MurJ (putative lipid II flippase)